MKYWITIVCIIIIFSSCGEHMKTIVKLSKLDNTFDVAYSTKEADYYFIKDDILTHCNKKKNRERNLVSITQLEQYINSFGSNRVEIPDTLGTKFVPEKEVLFIESNKLIRVRDQKHPYAYVSDEIRWLTIELARKGRICVYDKASNSYLDTLIIDKVETKDYGETNFMKTNDSIIFSQLRWIK